MPAPATSPQVTAADDKIGARNRLRRNSSNRFWGSLWAVLLFACSSPGMAGYFCRAHYAIVLHPTPNQSAWGWASKPYPVSVRLGANWVGSCCVLEIRGSSQEPCPQGEAPERQSRMLVKLLALVAVLSHVGFGQFLSQTCNEDRTAIIQSSAEAMLGGIIQMREHGQDGYGCGAPMSSMQPYEALRWALDLVNKKDELLNGQYLTDYYVPGIRLGMKVVDYCGHKDMAVSAVTQLFPSLASDDHSCSDSSTNLTLGIVGPTDSGSTADTSSFADDFDIPVVSFAATAPSLTYSGMYPTFLRTIPPDSGLVVVMAEVFQALNWDYVTVVYEDTTYGRSAYDELRSALAAKGICLTAAIMADPTDTSSNTVQGIIRQAVETDAIGTIFLGATSLAKAIIEEGLNVQDAGKLQWVFTDSLSLDDTFPLNGAGVTYAKGIISILPSSRYIVEFEDHWVRLDEENPSPENPWYQEWFMNKYDCNLQGFTGKSVPCSQIRQTEREKRLSFVQSQFVEPAVHSVFAYAYALRQAQIDKCGATSSGICPALRSMTHEDFLNDYLKKVEFTYAAQERVPSLASDQYAPYYAAKKLQFDARGDIINPAFAVWNYNDLPLGQGSAGLRFRNVGSYINGRLNLDTRAMRMYNMQRAQPLPVLPASPCPATGCAPCLGVPQDMKYMYVDGDIIINGIFSLHEMGLSKFTCGDLASNVHPQYLEAMFYAIKRVNQAGILNTGVRLGGLGIDDCMDSDLSTNFINMVQRGLFTIKDQSGNEMDPRKVEAYSGAYNRQLTIPLAGLMDIYRQPLVGYRATSAVLDRYKYYLKTVPGIADEFRAIILILKNYNWNHVQVVFSTDMYNEDDVMLFRRLAAEAGICVVASYNIMESLDNTMDMLSYHSSVRPVVLLLSANHLRHFLQILDRRGPSGAFTYIATAALGNDEKVVEGYETLADGFISIDLTLSPLTSFYNDLRALRIDPYSNVNPWFTEWYEVLHNCSVDANLGRFPEQCPDVVNQGIMDTSEPFERELRVGHVINAIYAIGRGLDSLLERYCGANYNSVCGAFASASLATKGEELLNEILRVSFPIEDLPSQTFSFQGRSGRLPYTIYNFRTDRFVDVGDVNPFTHSISITGTVQLSGGGNPSLVMPTCPRPCIECLYMFAFQQYWYIDGDLLIPAVFDIHFKGSSIFSCGALRHMNGVQYTEAFKFILDFINNGQAPGITLNNVRLGGIAFDGCSNVARSSAIINGVMGRTFPIMDDNEMMVDPSRFVSWLTYDSESTMEAADLLKMINMPIVTPGATAPQLLDKTRYSTFFRTVPSDSVIAKAMADLMNSMGWRYVITLNAPDAGSRESRDLFRQYLEAVGICVVASYEFETDGAPEIILRSIADSTTDVVAVFSEPDNYIPDMLRKKELLTDSETGRITFVSNRFWDLDRINGLQQTSLVAYNTLSFRMRNTRIPEFLSYLATQTLAGSSNPWLPEYYQALFECNLGGSNQYPNPCDMSTSRTLGMSSSPNPLDQDIWTLTTINAVHALAVAVDRTLTVKCGAGYSGVCNQFLTDTDTMDILMSTMDNETFTDLTGQFFDFVQREVNREYDVMRHDRRGIAPASVGSLSGGGVLSLSIDRDPTTGPYREVRSACPEDCLVCEGFESNFRNFFYIEGDLYIVGLFDVHKKGATPYTCGSINDRQGLQLLEAFNYAIEYMNTRSGELFSNKLRGVRIGAVGIDVCNSPTRAANLVANIQSGTIVLDLGGGVTISPTQIMAYVGPFDTPSTIRVADILSAIGVPQITYGATGLQLQDPVKYDYFLRSVPADDKQSRAIISYLKYFNLTNVQVVTSFESIGLKMTEEFKRLAVLNLVCITNTYTVGESGVITEDEADDVIQKLLQNERARVVILLVHDPFPILQAAGANDRADDEILWVATDKWGFDQEYLDGRLDSLLGDRRTRDNVIIFDIETADVPGFDQYLEAKTPGNYRINPWFPEYYEFLFGCSWNSGTCDSTRGISRADNYIQDPYVLYVVNAVFSCGLGIHKALKEICDDSTTTGYDGLCLKFQATGYRRDFVLQGMKESNFTDDTRQPFYYEPTGESGRGYHIYNVTANTMGIGTSRYMYDQVGSYNDTHFLKLDITYDIVYRAQCTPFVDCTCAFPRDIPSRYMAQPSPFELNLIYIGDIHQPHPTDPFSCSNINIGTDFYKMMAFFYAINRVNVNSDQRYRDNLRLGGVAVDTCSSTLRLDQDIFNLMSGFPLCDTDDTIQIIPPSSIVAFVPDGNANSVPVSRILASTGVTSLSPSATSSELRRFYMSENFLSVVPPDDLQATVIMQMMQELRWDYASIIYTEEPSMIAAKNELLSQAETARTACFGQALGLPLNAGIDEAEDVLERVSQQVGARAVVLFTLPAHTRLLMEAAGNKGMTGRFVWIGTSAWNQNGDELEDFKQEASGAIILQPHSVIVDDFRTYVKSLTFTNRGGIPDDWFEEIYQTLHRCTIMEAKRPLPFSTLCSKVERITDDMVTNDTSVLHTIIAVYMVAQGLNNIPSCRDVTFDISACLTNLKQSRNREIHQAILNAQYNVLPDLLGTNTFSFTFDKSGYGNIGFDILNFHPDPNGAGYTYTRLGDYSDNLRLNPRNYAGLSLFDVGVVPNSNCIGLECKCAGPTSSMSGSRSGAVVGGWTYVPRQASVKVTEEGRTYQDPETGELYYVEKIPDLATRFSDMWGVAVATLAAIGVFVSLALFIYLLVVYPVRGGTSILGYVLAFGIILLYGLVFAFVAHVNSELCGLRRFCLGFCYAICYSALFVKLVDCWRSRDKEDIYDVKYNKLGRPFGLFMVCVLLVLVQEGLINEKEVMINAEWLILEPPEVVRIFYNNQYWPRCTPNDFYDEGLVLSLCYIMVLIFLTIVLGFMTFNSTKNHREARWILGMAILAVPTWVVWCAWSTLGAIKTRDAAVAVGLLINATVLLLLGPIRKLYLLNKYQVLIEEQDREEQREARSVRGSEYGGIYDNQYDNAPRLQDSGSAMGSTRGFRKWRRSLLDVRAKRGADAASDHHLVIAAIKIKLKAYRDQADRPSHKYNVHSLKESVKTNAFR
ncbi:hypothetical protein BaRGS_00027202, partial [Batillaria attramentaria]